MGKAEETYESINTKLELIIQRQESERQEKDKLNRILFGEDGTGGIIKDVKDIKITLIGDPAYQKEGILSIIKNHDDFYKKMQSMGKMAFMMASIGGAIGSGLMWIAHRFDKIKDLFQ